MDFCTISELLLQAPPSPRASVSPYPQSLRAGEGGFSHTVCVHAVGHGVSISAGAAFPGLLPLSLMPWHGKAASGKRFAAL